MNLELSNDEIQEFTRLRQLNKELMEANYYLFERLFQAHRKNGIGIDKPELESLFLRVRHILIEINHQPKVNTDTITDKETEPALRNC